MTLLDDSVTHGLAAARISGRRNSYAADNPAEWAAVKAYLTGGVRPVSVATEMGKHLLALEDARRAGYALPATPPPSSAVPFWTWAKVADIPDQHDMTNGRIVDATFAGRQCMKVTVTDAADSSGGGDGSYGTTGNMNEPWATEGADSWHSLKLYVPSATWHHSVISSGWNTFMEFHEPAIAQRSTHFGVWGSDPPVLQMAATGGDVNRPTDVWVHDSQPLIMDAWQDWLIHMHWSNGPRGYIEWWVNGRQIVSRTSKNLVSDPSQLGGAGGPALADNYPNAWNQNGSYRAPYFQCGHYRGPSRSDTDITYIADVKSGPTRESVS